MHTTNTIDAEREALLRLVSAHGVGAVAIGRLLAAFGSGCAALEASDLAWSAALAWAPARAERCRAEARSAPVDEAFAMAASMGLRIVGSHEPGYPALLRAIPDPPAVLWTRGEFLPIDDWSVAIVGARRCSAYGIDQAARFARGLVEHGHTIVSGGARGIDAEAHRATLRAGGRTVAVLGSGLACPYPPEHRRLFDEIAEGGGAVVSEHPPMTEPRSGFFPRRNRIIAGLAIAVVLVEARARSGASITARLAVEDLGREVLAIPGRVDVPTSEGTHKAIREGWAALATSPADVVEHLRERGAPKFLIQGARRATSDPPPSALGLESPLRRQLAERLVEGGAMTLGALVDGAEAGACLAELTMLELASLVRRDAEGRWEARAPLVEAIRAQAPLPQTIRGP